MYDPEYDPESDDGSGSAAEFDENLKRFKELWEKHLVPVKLLVDHLKGGHELQLDISDDDVFTASRPGRPPRPELFGERLGEFLESLADHLKRIASDLRSSEQD